MKHSSSLPLHLFLIVIALLTFSAGASKAQWRPTNGPTGGRGWGIAQQGSDLYVVVNDGAGTLYHSTDQAATWGVRSTNPNIGGLIVAGQFMFSTNVNSSPELMFSNDAGASWRSDTIAKAVRYITSIEHDGTHLFAATDTGLYVSVDNGGTWTKPDQSAIGHITSINNIAGKLYAGTQSGAIYGSSDHAQSWSLIGNLPLAQNGRYSVSQIAKTGINLFAIGSNKPFRSQDGGATWAPTTSVGIGSDTLAFSLFTDGTTLFMYSAHNHYSIGKLYRWQSSGAWLEAGNGMPELVSGIVFQQSKLIAITGTGVFVSNDAAASWKPSNVGMVLRTDALGANNGTLYADHGGYLYLSSDAGANWSDDRVNHYGDSILFGSTSIGQLAAYGNNMLAADGLYGIFLLPPDGSQRTLLTKKMDFFSHGVPTGLATMGSTIFASANDIYDQVTQGYHSGVFVSTDNAQTFSERNAGLTDTLITAMTASGNDLYATSQFRKFFYSSDQGMSWTLQSTFPKDPLTALTASGSTIVGTTGSAIMVSIDKGVHWIARSEGLAGLTAMRSLTSDLQYAYVSTEKGVYRRRLSEMLGVNTTRASQPMIECYPNPASFSSTIVIRNASHGAVQLRAFDALGRVRFSATDAHSLGEHRFEISTRDWPAGCYMMQLSNASGVLGSVPLVKK